jgi:hypothetical protein
MLSYVNACRSTFLLAVGTILFSTSLPAQESTQYFRYYEVKLDQSIRVQTDIRADIFGEKPFEIYGSCDSKNSVVVKVPANYPKRVYQIEEELKNAFSQALKESKITSLSPLKATDTESFCQ